MDFGILGTGVVGCTLGYKLTELGHRVKMGSRTSDNPKAVEWARKAGPNASYGTFADAASFGEVIFNCTAGAASLQALTMAGAHNFKGKVLIDVANPLDFSTGMPPTLFVCNTDSLAEQIQREFPDARVVKALNTMNCAVMVNPSLVPGDHNVFLSGNDPQAKATVIEILGWFGWKRDNIIDLGDITTARGPEMAMALWLRLWRSIGHTNFNFHIALGPRP
jgi:predicted dinucleotide-binding enzyme